VVPEPVAAVCRQAVLHYATATTASLAGGSSLLRLETIEPLT
jgi:hypothetical protein